MAVTMKRDTRMAMEAAIASDTSAANPFVREGETTFMRCDEVRLSQDAAGTVSIAMFWRSTPTYTTRVDCDLAAGQVLTLSGFDGRMAVSLR